MFLELERALVAVESGFEFVLRRIPMYSLFPWPAAVTTAL